MELFHLHINQCQMEGFSGFLNFQIGLNPNEQNNLQDYKNLKPRGLQYQNKPDPKEVTATKVWLQ